MKTHARIRPGIAALGIFWFPGFSVWAIGLPPVEMTYPVSQSATVVKGALTPANNFLLCMEANVRCISPEGTLLWTCESPVPLRAITTGADGSIYACGTSRATPSGPADVAVIRISASGSIQWTQTAGLPADNEFGDYIVADDQGRVYCAGYSAAPGSTADIFVASFDSSGASPWTRKFSGSANLTDNSAGLIAMPGGGVTVAGLVRNPAEQFITIRYNATGSAQWVAFYDHPDVQEQRPAGLVHTTDGGIAVTGLSGLATLATVKYSAGGTRQWVSRLELSNQTPAPYCLAAAITASPGGGAAVLASVHGENSATCMVASISSSGNSNWLNPVRTLPGVYVGGLRLSAQAGGGYVIGAGENSYNSSHSADDLARLSTINEDGTGAADRFTWPLPGVTNVTTALMLSAADGSVWAVAKIGLYDVQVKRFGPSPPPAGLPAATGPAFDNLQWNSVRLKGQVNPNGAATSAWFEYGPTTAYGSTTPARSMGSTPALVDLLEPGLAVTPGAVYHFRLVASNSVGTTQSADATFTVPYSGLQTWTIGHFGSLSAPGTAPGDDADSDSHSNLVEYALGGHPLESGQPGGLPVFALWESPESGITFPSIVYRPEPGRTGLTITPQVSNDLTDWSTSGVVMQNLPDGTVRAVAQGLHRFMRLRISSP